MGLTGYYYKFVCNYGHISRHLTNLLKKNSFLWTDEAQQVFMALKQAMCSTPILALPDFTKYFVIECDASGTGIGALLMQEGRPLAFTSQQLSGKHMGQSTYEKEMMALTCSRYMATILIGAVFPNPHRPSKPQIFFGATSILTPTK